MVGMELEPTSTAHDAKCHVHNEAKLEKRVMKTTVIMTDDTFCRSLRIESETRGSRYK